MAKYIEDDAEFAESLGAMPLSKYKKIRTNFRALSTGIVGLDFAIAGMDGEGNIGVKQRDVLELIGDNNSLKTAISEEMMLETQRAFPGEKCIAWVYSEPPNTERMEEKGIDLDLIYTFGLRDPETGEFSEQVAENSLMNLVQLCKRGSIKLAGVDSVAALVANAQLFDGKNERDLDVNPVAALAKIFNNFINHFKLKNECAVLVLINHYKEPIKTGFSFSQDFRTTRKSPGGRGMEFLGDVRVFCQAQPDYSKTAHSKEGTYQEIGKKPRLEVFKNKYANRTASRTVTGYFDLQTKRFNNEEKLLEITSFFGTRNAKTKTTISPFDPPVAQSGAWVYVGDKSFNGMENAVKYLEQNRDIYDKLRKQIAGPPNAPKNEKYHELYWLDTKGTVKVDGILEGKNEEKE